MTDEKYWVALAETLGARSRVLRPLLDAFGTPQAIFDAGEAELTAAVPDLPRGVVASFTSRRAFAEAERITLWCHGNGVRILTMADAEYPARLSAIAEPPAVLYCKGALPRFDDRMAVGVVGTRHPDAYGERAAYKLSFELAAAGVLIVSGLAEGIDGISAAATVDAGGTPVAILGCGIDITYPKHHVKLAAEVAEYGCILTEFAPGTRPLSWNFPVRNRLISALSGALLVVEAGENSGSLITARYAIVQGKLLFALPGDITESRSAGTNALLRAGALLALGAEDVLSHFRFLYGNAVREQAYRESTQFSEVTREALTAHGIRTALGEPPRPPKTSRGKDKGGKDPAPQERTKDRAKVTESSLSMLDPQQRECYDLFPEEPVPVDFFTGKGISTAEAAAMLTVLEIYGLIEACPGGTYRKK